MTFANLVGHDELFDINFGTVFVNISRHFGTADYTNLRYVVGRIHMINLAMDYFSYNQSRPEPRPSEICRSGWYDLDHPICVQERSSGSVWPHGGAM